MNVKKKAMGRGLNALLEDSNFDKENINSYVSAYPNIPIEDIVANPYQPRTSFEEESLNGLAISIKNQGIIQPITVKKLENGKFQIISGERRYRASIIAGLKEIPAYIKEIEDNEILELALVENIQREDLNSIEIAISFQRLIEECGLTQEKLSNRIGKSRSSIANYIRLLKLPPEVQIAIRDNKISMGHARAIINVDDEKTQLNILKKTINNDLSVRQVEDLVRNISKNIIKTTKSPVIIPEKAIAWRDNLSKKTKAKVAIKVQGDGRGTISISFKDSKQFNEIMKHIQ